MAETNEVKALEKISTEVGDSQIKITLSSQCIKAQTFLLDKLRKQSERQKEICNYISNSNFKLQTEIKQAELEIKSLLTAFDTIKSGNVELKKECFLVKERRADIEERVSTGEKKYEDLWVQAKKRYESIPYVQTLLDTTDKSQILKERIITLDNQIQSFKTEIETKKQQFIKIDKQRIIEMVEYLVIDLPKGVKLLHEKTQSVTKVSKEIDELLRKQKDIIHNPNIEAPLTANQKTNEYKMTTKIGDGWLKISQNIEQDTLMIPTIHLMNPDFDVLSAKLDKIKIKKVEIQSITPAKRVDSDEPVQISSKRVKREDGYSMFLNQPAIDKSKDDVIMKKNNYSNKRLINILEDIKIDKSDAYSIVSKVNLEKLQGVDKIGIMNSTNDKQDVDLIEEIDLTNTNEENVIIPPTQFLDSTKLIREENKIGSSQQEAEVIVHKAMNDPTTDNINQVYEVNKKVVSFDLPHIQDVNNETSFENQKIIENKGDEANDSINSQLNLSCVSDESYTKMKDMILKKHNLDLSPKFVYAKNNALNKENEKLITSKFFQLNKLELDDKKCSKSKEMFQAKTENENMGENWGISQQIQEIGINIDADEVVVSSPKSYQIEKGERSVTGLLFNHGTQGIPDSLNVSMSTTGFEEGDTDFPQCIDSSLLLSPKADIPLPLSGDKIEVSSQEVPNFLSGLRKSGFSFFGQTSETKPDTGGQNQGNNFNFNFGTDNKKSRGGLFSIFK